MPWCVDQALAGALQGASRTVETILHRVVQGGAPSSVLMVRVRTLPQQQRCDALVSVLTRNNEQGVAVLVGGVDVERLSGQHILVLRKAIKEKSTPTWT